MEAINNEITSRHVRVAGYDLFFFLTKYKKYGILRKMKKVKSKNTIKNTMRQQVEAAYTVLLSYKHKKIPDEAIKTVVNLLMPYKSELEIRGTILDLLAYKDTKARVLIKSATTRLEKLLKRR